MATRTVAITSPINVLALPIHKIISLFYICQNVGISQVRKLPTSSSNQKTHLHESLESVEHG